MEVLKVHSNVASVLGSFRAMSVLPPKEATMGESDKMTRRARMIGNRHCAPTVSLRCPRHGFEHFGSIAYSKRSLQLLVMVAKELALES